RRAAAGRAARRPVRWRGERRARHRRSPRRRPDVEAEQELRHARGDRQAAGRRRLRRRARRAATGADALRAGRAPRDLPADGDPRRRPAPDPGGAPARVLPRRGVADGDPRDRLRPPEYRRPPGLRGTSRVRRSFVLSWARVWVEITPRKDPPCLKTTPPPQ